MSLVQTLRSHRLRLGMTQSELSHLAGVSLPTLQILEGGRSNPSIETLTKLGEILGLSIELKASPCDWATLCELGLPLMKNSKPKAQSNNWNTRGRSQKTVLVKELLKALDEVVAEKANSENERKTDALSGLVLAIYEHYPSFFKKYLAKNPHAIDLIRAPCGRVIKLKRIALAKVSEYL